MREHSAGRFFFAEATPDCLIAGGGRRRPWQKRKTRQAFRKKPRITISPEEQTVPVTNSSSCRLRRLKGEKGEKSVAPAAGTVASGNAKSNNSTVFERGQRKSRNPLRKNLRPRKADKKSACCLAEEGALSRNRRRRQQDRAVGGRRRGHPSDRRVQE